VSEVFIQTGIQEEDQQSSFQNATLQSAGMNALSIATFLEIPNCIADQGEAVIAEYAKHHLAKAADSVEGLKFEVQIGPAAE